MRRSFKVVPEEPLHDWRIERMNNMIRILRKALADDMVRAKTGRREGRTSDPKVGQRVGYKSVLADQDFSHVAKVDAVYPDGIPSCRKRMVTLAGKAGVVLWAHCTPLEGLVDGPQP